MYKLTLKSTNDNLKVFSTGETEVEAIKNLPPFYLDDIYRHGFNIIYEELKQEHPDCDTEELFISEDRLPDALFRYCDRNGFEQIWTEE